MKKFGCILAILVALFIGAGLFVYPGLKTTANTLNPKLQNVDYSWGQVQDQYQRRADMTDQLVNTVQGAANFEKSTLTAVTDARASVGRVTIDASHAPQDAAKLKEYADAQGQITSALSHLMSVVENYPNLKSNENFLRLQATIEGTENRVSVSRRRFNDAVRDYDTARDAWPERFFVGFLGFAHRPYFEADSAAQSAPKIKFDFNGK